MLTNINSLSGAALPINITHLQGVVTWVASEADRAGVSPHSNVDGDTSIFRDKNHFTITSKTIL